MDPAVIKPIAIMAFFVLLFVVLPIVVLMLEHQRKMARLLRGEKVEDNENSLAVLMGVNSDQSAQIEELKRRLDALEHHVATLSPRPPAQPNQEDPSVRELLA